MNPKIFDLIFEADTKDDQKTAEKKRARQRFSDQILEDDLIMSTYVGKISFLSSEKFLDKIQGIEHPHNTQIKFASGSGENLNLRIALENWDYFKSLLVRLETVYKETFLNYKERMSFVDKIFEMRSYVEICSRVKLEIEFFEDYKARNSSLIALVRKREMIKASIMNTAMGYSSLGQIGKLNRELSSQYSVLRAVL